jgi:putative methionine-R-sulfoxide reductase with GAF domain
METPAAKPAETGRAWNPALGERRRRVRQKVHAPAYASLDTNSSGIILDLNEILDISEEGMAIQTAAPPAIDSDLELSLDLAETKSFIHTTGKVVWSDRSGRTGIRFPNMPFASVRQLKEWLFLNAITACSNHLAVPASTLRTQVMHSEPMAAPAVENPEAPTSPDYTEMLGALSAVQREIESLGNNLEAALRLVVERAQTFTKASGAAIALRQNDEMVCRASAGDAPPVGARLQVGSGFSGECVRAGRLLRCDDSETDTRVDRESCRVLGIRSMIATPVQANGAVAGLLEVFSPAPRAFADSDNIVVRRLADTCASAVRRARGASKMEDASLPPSTEASREFAIGEAIPSDHSLLHHVMIAMVVLAIVGVSVWLWVTSTGKKETSTQAIKPQAVAKSGVASPVSDLEGMRRLAQQGDPAAQFALGAHYVTGEGVPQDYAQAVHWFSLAAEHNHAIAQSTLGAYYDIGRGVPQDFSKAYFWSILAQANGDEASKYRIPMLVAHLSRAQILTIQQQANEWLKQHQLASSKPAPGR